jgi:hypothetical protein
MRLVRVLGALLPLATTADAEEIHYSPEERLDAIDATLIATARNAIDLTSYALMDSLVVEA